MLCIFGGCLFILNQKGYLSFSNNSGETNANNNAVDENNDSTTDNNNDEENNNLTDDSENNEEDDDTTTNNDTTEENNNVTNDNTTNKDNNVGKECTNIIVSKDTINANELSKFSKSDYNFIKNESTTNYSFNLSVDGKININFEKNISNISNAKDIHLFKTTSANTLYILTTNGDVYKYDLSNYDSGNYNATKISEYSNIKKMLIYRTRRAYAGGCDYLIIIDNNEKYYSLNSSCV